MPSLLADASRQHTATANNDRYVVSAHQDQVSVFDLRSGERRPLDVFSPSRLKHANPVLALSPLEPTRLAIALNSQLFVVDIVANEILQTSSGNGRTVTALSWSKSSRALATGTLDGRICLWDPECLSKPSYQYATRSGIVQQLAFDAQHENVLASLQNGRVHIWNSHSVLKPQRILDEGGEGFTYLAWDTANTSRLLASSKDGNLRLFDLGEALISLEDSSNCLDSEEEDEIFPASVDGLDKESAVVAQCPLGSSINYTQWIDHSLLLCLASHGRKALLLRINDDCGRMEEVWSCALAPESRAIHLSQRRDGIVLLVSRYEGCEAHTIPLSALENFELSLSGLPFSPSSSPKSKFEGRGDSSSESTNIAVERKTAMHPKRISGYRRDRPAAVKTAQQLRHRSIHTISETPKLTSQRWSKDLGKSSRPVTPVTAKAMTSSLELPILSHDDSPPMPFLSPSIPSRKVSPQDLPPIDDNMQLPPVREQSFETSLASTEPDSESDDDTFAENLTGSGALLPGGVHVPLPKFCGALFAPNGQLLLYFPSRLSVSAGAAVENEPEQQEASAERMAKIFPTFGNLLGDTNELDLEIEIDDNSLSELDDGDRHRIPPPTFSFQAASFPSNMSWNTKTSPVKTNFKVTSDSQITVSIRDLCAEGFPDQRALASQYKILRSSGETGADVCIHNASVASQAGLDRYSEIWNVLGMLLDDKIPPEFFSVQSRYSDAIELARSARVHAHSASCTDSAIHPKQSAACQKLRWADHPYGASWLIRKLLDWVEQRADSQMLALICAILSEPHCETSMNGISSHDLIKRLPAYSPDLIATSAESIASSLKAHLPSGTAYHSASAILASTESSPAKLQLPASGSMLGHHSQPVTPHLESLSPSNFAWASISRQSTHLSNSTAQSSFHSTSSASPEHSRGSFSSAAKHYAQSITDRFADKFSTYGTSPPMKKGGLNRSGASPSSYEGLSSGLSTSLPRGSLTKSVSFAPTAETPRGSGLSRSYDGQPDIRPDLDRDEGYESDKTVDGSSTAPFPSPKAPTKNVSVRLKNHGAFTDDMSGGAQSHLIPPDIKAKSILWTEYYAEQLRVWGMWAEAADLEKVASLTAAVHTPGRSPEYDGDRKQVRTTSKADPKPTLDSSFDIPMPATCTICFTTERGLYQTCPQCCHTSHLNCLGDYAVAIGAVSPSSVGSLASQVEIFSCPAGCGCSCADLQFDQLLRAADAFRYVNMKALNDQMCGLTPTYEVKLSLRVPDLTASRSARVDAPLQLHTMSATAEKNTPSAAPTFRSIEILQTQSSQLYTNLHPILLPSLLLLNFRTLVDDPVNALLGLAPTVALLQGIYCVLCLPTTGKSPPKPGQLPKKKSASGSAPQNHSQQQALQQDIWARIVPAILSLLLTLFLTTPLLFIGVVLFGAPLTSVELPHTLLFALHLALLTTPPLFYARGLDATLWRHLVSLQLPLDEAYGMALGACAGAWVGAVPIPLDWDRDWQRWPVTVVVGVYGGVVIGKVLGGSSWAFRGRKMEIS